MAVYAAALAFGAAAIVLGFLAGPASWASLETWAARLLDAEDATLPLAALALGAAALLTPALAHGAASIADRRWREARDVVADDVARDADRLLNCIDALIHRERSLDAATALFEFANDPRLQDRLVYLKPSFSGEMALYIAEYMERRNFISEQLYTVDSDPAQLQQLFARRGGGEWRFSDLPTRAQGGQGGDYETHWRVLRAVGDLATLIADRPMGGWRTRSAHRSVVARAEVVARRFAM